jgi:hypothetical protein
VLVLLWGFTVVVVVVGGGGVCRDIPMTPHGVVAFMPP